MHRMGRPAAGLVAVGLLAALAGCTAAPVLPTASPTPSAVVTRTPTPSPTPSPTPTFDRSAHSIDDPSSIWVVVDKLRPLHPASFVPADLTPVDVPHTNPPILRKPAALAVERMFAAAAAAGVHLASNSTYRPYADQRRVYDADRAQLGLAGADRLTARPGFSEHQTGLAIDIGTASGHCDLDPCFARTPEGRWVATHAWRFGFVLRYPAGDEHLTGIEYEPWHFRYVGDPLAAEYHDSHAATLEQFFGLPPSPSYR